MNANSAVGTPQRRNAFLAITSGGLSAGTLDLAQALVLFGTKVPLGIAAGLLGRQAAHGGGLAIYVLGVFLHFFIAFSATAVYYLVSRTLKCLTEHGFICGLIYGAMVDQVMTLIVVPLSALHAHGPHKLHGPASGYRRPMFTVGLPISFSVRRFAK